MAFFGKFSALMFSAVNQITFSGEVKLENGSHCQIID